MTEIFRTSHLQGLSTMIYHTVLGDTNGNPTEKMWDTESILSDHRIPPEGEVTESFSLTLPDLTTPIYKSHAQIPVFPGNSLISCSAKVIRSTYH